MATVADSKTTLELDEPLRFSCEEQFFRNSIVGGICLFCSAACPGCRGVFVGCKDREKCHKGESTPLFFFEMMNQCERSSLPDSAPSAAAPATSTEAQIRSSTTANPAPSTQALPLASAAFGGVISPVTVISRPRFLWTHAVFSTGALAVSAAGTAVLFKKACVLDIKGGETPTLVRPPDPSERKALRTVPRSLSLAGPGHTGAKERGSGDDLLTACEGTWGAVKKMEPGLSRYRKEGASGSPLSRCAFLAQINTKVSADYLRSLENNAPSISEIEETRFAREAAGSEYP
ncbi:hypothetical protein MLD38_039200 [Melastoma candidum]|uniref:Uncharacterized protein n=1 Tax=Melastoma candidum TaxID=119954 RepID=A0ACB9L2V5_9MYRT|nr:hypothetical protein MLD38_039200 [Melastoma candidum]